MATNFPTTLDTIVELPSPAPETPLNQSGTLKHSTQHTNENDALIAVESKLGVRNSTVPETVLYRMEYDNDTLRTAVTNADSEEFDGSTVPGTFSWVNQGSSMVSVANGQLRMTGVQGSSVFSLLVKTVATGTSWRYEMAISTPMIYNAFAMFALAVRHTSSGKWVGIGMMGMNTTNTWRLNLMWGNASGYVGDLPYVTPNLPSRMYYAVERSGSNLYFEYSLNGSIWTRQYSILTSGTEIGNPPDQVGILYSSSSGTTAFGSVAHVSYIRRVF